MELSKRHLFFSLFTLLLIVILHSPIKLLIGLSVHDQLYSHILLIPIISIFFLYWKRKSIFLDDDGSFINGAIVIGVGSLLLIAGFVRFYPAKENDVLSLLLFAGWLVWIGAFVLLYGVPTFKRASFPLLFLLFTVPVPGFATEALINFLQEGSTETVNVLFSLLGFPMTREGHIFHLPQFSVEVAKQCSGINSSVALIITGALAANLFLRRGFTRALAVISVIPITIFKNALRVVVLAGIGVYVDEGIFQSILHRKGGILFFGLALLLLMAVIVLLKKVENKAG
jgi:exosortase